MNGLAKYTKGGQILCLVLVKTHKLYYTAYIGLILHLAHRRVMNVK